MTARTRGRRQVRQPRRQASSQMPSHKHGWRAGCRLRGARPRRGVSLAWRRSRHRRVGRAAQASAVGVSCCVAAA
eukprot:365831-Chlamydomonas_euryale.AAC.13